MLEMTKPKGIDTGGALSSLDQKDAKLPPPDVATNLKRIRRQQGFSLETLAGLSGVSRAMLGQIETGKSIPTVTVVWKIASALGVATTDLISESVAPRFTVLERSTCRIISSPDGRFLQHPLSSSHFRTPYDFSEIEIAPGYNEAFHAWPPGSRATLLAISGEIEVRFDDGSAATAKQGDCILFQADQPHSVFNPGPHIARAYVVLGSLKSGSI